MAAAEKIKKVEKLLAEANPSKESLLKAKKILEEILNLAKAKPPNKPTLSPTQRLLGANNFEELRSNYIQGISPALKAVINDPKRLKNKLDSIFSGISEYLYQSQLQKLKSELKGGNPELTAREYSTKNWHALANSIATHARIIHGKTPTAPDLLYISLNKTQLSAKVVVLTSPSAGEINTELHPDTKSINYWIKKLELY